MLYVTYKNFQIFYPVVLKRSKMNYNKGKELLLKVAAKVPRRQMNSITNINLMTMWNFQNCIYRKLLKFVC